MALFVFSDDIEWCKKQGIFNNCNFCDENSDEIYNLNMMASCVGHIIANSSFSWWGAWLSTHNGKVVAPKAWYTDGIDRTFCPKEWIRL